MESAAMVPGSIGGSARLHSPVVADAWFSQSIFLHLFVCIRSLAIFGLPWNHHALRQWDCPLAGTIQTLARLAGAWSHLAAGRNTVSAYVAAEPDVHRQSKRFIGRLLPGIPLVGWRTVNLGQMLYETNRIPEAMELFKQALGIKPAVAHYSLGNALTRTGRASEAMDEYEAALRIDPDYAEAHNNLGDALFLTGRNSEAIDEYEQALRIDPDYAEAHNNLGNALVQTGRASEAIDTF